MSRLLLIAVLAVLAASGGAQKPWQFRAESGDGGVVLHIDLYEESVDVPGMEMFGPMNGYLAGRGVYGVWMVTSCEVQSDGRAELHLSNDLGSETQRVRLTLTDGGECLFEQVGGCTIKKAENHKLVKLPSKFTLKLKK